MAIFNSYVKLPEGNIKTIQTYQTCQTYEPYETYETQHMKKTCICIELDDGKILTGKPDQFDGKNPWFPVKIFP